MSGGVVYFGYMKQTRRPVKKFGLNALVWSEGSWYVAKAVEVEIASQGKTVPQALRNLTEAIELYFEDEKIPVKQVSVLSDLRLEKLFPKFQYA